MEERHDDDWGGWHGDGNGGGAGSLSSLCREWVGRLLPRVRIAEIRQITPVSIVLDMCLHSVN